MFLQQKYQKTVLTERKVYMLSQTQLTVNQIYAMLLC